MSYNNSKAARRRRRRRKKILQTILPPFIAVVLIIIVGFAGQAMGWFDSWGYSTEKADLNSYFQCTGADQATVIRNGEMTEERMLVKDNRLYLDMDTVASIFNDGFYWESTSGNLLFTADEGTYSTALDSMDYKLNGSSTQTGYTTCYLKGETLMVCLDYVSLFSDFEYIFGKMDRIGIIGPNGCGKSTLLKVITGLVSPDTGSVEIGQTVKIGYFGQENDELKTTGRVIDAIKEKGEFVQTKDGAVSASKMCETFLFDGNMQYTPVTKLSGGEKRRLYLLQVLMTSPNVLILDEPTNDLDIQTLRVLEDYLDTFQGIVITVSHDRYFLDRVVTRIFSFEPDGTIARSEGGYEDYYERGFASTSISGLPVTGKLPEKVGAIKAYDEDAVSKDTWKKPREKKKLSYNEQKEYDTIEDDIDNLQVQIDELEAVMVANATDYPKLAEASAKKQELETLMDQKMERFIYLQDLVDSFESN